MDSKCWGNTFESEGFHRNDFGSNSAQILWSDIPKDELNSGEMPIDSFNKEEPFIRFSGDSLCHPHAPYLEMRERSLAASRESALDRSTSMFQTYKGQIKIAVYKNCGLLTAHIIEARHLNVLMPTDCNIFVKISIVPDNDKRTRCKTNNVQDTTHPIFDEKFSFEICEEDRRKRLTMSVWNRQTDGSRDFLGCTSFGIRHLESKHKSINGWYFLLTEEIGRRKHLKVDRSKKDDTLTSSRKRLCRSSQSVCKGVSSFLSPTEICNHSEGKDTDYNIPHQEKGINKFLIFRGRDGGFGFSVTGAEPVLVCSVQPNGSAVEAGLRENDIIKKLNGNDVQFSSADTVAVMIRNSSNSISLEVKRQIKPWTVWRPPTLSDIPECISTRCPSPTSVSCDLISGFCSFGKQKKKKR